jgi:hypothetical protein
MSEKLPDFLAEELVAGNSAIPIGMTIFAKGIIVI